MTPNWNHIATAPLAEGDEIEAQFDIAADNFIAAVARAVEALEHNGMPELAEHLCESFLKTFCA